MAVHEVRVGNEDWTIIVTSEDGLAGAELTDVIARLAAQFIASCADLVDIEEAAEFAAGDDAGSTLP